MTLKELDKKHFESLGSNPWIYPHKLIVFANGIKTMPWISLETVPVHMAGVSAEIDWSKDIGRYFSYLSHNV